MNSLNDQYQVVEKGLLRLAVMISLFHEYKKKYATEQSNELFEVTLGLRDSMIRRFANFVDGLVDYLELYLIDQRFCLPIGGPRVIVRYAVLANRITEQQGKYFIDMLDCRNLTSHTYHEDIAQEVAGDIPAYYAFMQEIIKKVQP